VAATPARPARPAAVGACAPCGQKSGKRSSFGGVGAPSRLDGQASRETAGPQLLKAAASGRQQGWAAAGVRRWRGRRPDRAHAKAQPLQGQGQGGALQAAPGGDAAKESGRGDGIEAGIMPASNLGGCDVLLGPLSRAGCAAHGFCRPGAGRGAFDSRDWPTRRPGIGDCAGFGWRKGRMGPPQRASTPSVGCCRRMSSSSWPRAPAAPWARGSIRTCQGDGRCGAADDGAGSRPALVPGNCSRRQDCRLPSAWDHRKTSRRSPSGSKDRLPGPAGSLGLKEAGSGGKP